MKQTAYNVVTSAVLFAALWLGFVERVEGAQYVVVLCLGAKYGGMTWTI